MLSLSFTPLLPWPAIAVLTLMSMWGMLRADQFLSGVLVWPHQGARFVEISDGLPATPPGETTGDGVGGVWHVAK